MTLTRLQDIIAELRAGGRLNADDWALVFELYALCSQPCIDEQAERRRAADRERHRAGKLRGKLCGNSAEIPQNDPISISNSNIGLQEGGMGGTNSAETPQKPVDHLKTILDDEHASAVVEHRQKLRKPLTARAAKALAKALAKAPNPNQAAEAMLARGWAGFDVAWLKTNGKSNVVEFVSSGPKRTWAEIQAEKKARQEGEIA